MRGRFERFLPCQFHHPRPPALPLAQVKEQGKTWIIQAQVSTIPHNHSLLCSPFLHSLPPLLGHLNLVNQSHPSHYYIIKNTRVAATGLAGEEHPEQVLVCRRFRGRGQQLCDLHVIPERPSSVPECECDIIRSQMILGD